MQEMDPMLNSQFNIVEEDNGDGFNFIGDEDEDEQLFRWVH